MARQQGAAARPCSSDMPPPPPRPGTALQPRPTADAAGSSSESDIDVDIDLDDSSSPEIDHVTAAWIERQRRCPEPFLSAADYARRAGRRPNRAAAAAPVAAAAAATAPAHPGQASAFTQAAAAAGQNMLAPARTSPSARQSLLAAAEGSASASQRLPAATQGIATATQGSSVAAAQLSPAAAAQLSPAAGQATVLPRAGVKNSMHGVKPPLYPAKRLKSPDGGGSSIPQASAGHAAGTAACPTPSTVSNPSYTAAEPGVGATAPTQSAPNKPDATVDATPPSTYAHTGSTAEVAVASCTDMNEGLVPGAHPHAPIPVAAAASPAASQAQCVNCQPAEPCDM